MTQTIERHSVKIQVATILALVMLSFHVGRFSMDAEARLGHIESDQLENRERISVCEINNNKTEVRLAEINTKLANIEALLLELKRDRK